MAFKHWFLALYNQAKAEGIVKNQEEWAAHLDLRKTPSDEPLSRARIAQFLRGPDVPDERTILQICWKRKKNLADQLEVAEDQKHRREMLTIMAKILRRRDSDGNPDKHSRHLQSVINYLLSEIAREESAGQNKAPPVEQSG